MKILILTASLPYPPASGGALRSYGLIRGLHAAGHELTLLSFHDKPLTTSPLNEYCTPIETVVPPRRTKIDRLRDLVISSQPDIAHRTYGEEFVEKLRALLAAQKFDLIQFEGIETACYIPIARTAQPTAKLCFDTFNAEYALQRVIFEVDRHEVKRWPAALYSLIQSRRIYHFEREMCQLSDLVIAVSPEDADALRGFRNDRKVFVVPNGIVTDIYQQRTDTLKLQRNALVFTGKMDYRPNVDAMLWFADEILPHIPNAHLYIVGQQPHPRLNTLRDKPNITLSGWVESVQPYLQSASVYVAPLRMGSGTRLKLLEAMASGCTVVATSIAASGLLPEMKQTMIVANSPTEFAQSVIQLLKDSERRAELGNMARTAVKLYYDWQVIIPRLLAAYRDIGLG